MNTLEDTLAETGSARRTYLLAAAATLLVGTAAAQTTRGLAPAGVDPMPPSRASDEDGWFDAVPESA